MERSLEEAKEEFIQLWGTLGSRWGINRTMAQVHALLLSTPKSLCADEIMSALSISRGNVNMNLRALIDWGLIRKTHKSGERKEFFYAEKDIWKMARQIIRERKRRELDPLRSTLDELVEVKDASDEAQEFKAMIQSLRSLSEEADKGLDLLMRSDRKWILETLLKVMG